MAGVSDSLHWGDPLAASRPSAASGLRFAAVVAAHAAVLWGGMELAARPEVRAAAEKIMVRLVEPPKPVEPPAKPPPPKREARPLPPPPVLAAAADAPATSSFVVPAPPPAPPSLPPVNAPVVAAPPAITAARFDADYLSNPKPAYPAASRRLGEEGRVLLRVRVSAEGMATAVDIKHSSGHSRLDDSARAAVERWHFVPAKRGADPVESWVLVPIVFSLQTS